MNEYPHLSHQRPKKSHKHPVWYVLYRVESTEEQQFVVRAIGNLRGYALTYVCINMQRIVTQLDCLAPCENWRHHRNNIVGNLSTAKGTSINRKSHCGTHVAID